MGRMLSVSDQNDGPSHLFRLCAPQSSRSGLSVSILFNGVEDSSHSYLHCPAFCKFSFKDEEFFDILLI